MENQYVLNKFVNALNTLSDADLRHLARMLKQPKVNEDLARLIESTLALRHAERNSKLQKGDGASYRNRMAHARAETTNLAARGYEVPIRSMEDVKNTFIGLLEDRNLFRSTRDVVDSVNTSFQCGIEYEKFRKRGRRPVIRKCLQHLSGFPVSKQIEVLRSFLNKISDEASRLEQYRELFRFLAGYE